MNIGVVLGLTIFMVSAVALITFGVLLWKKQKIALVRDCHHEHVENMKGFTSDLGKAFVALGVLVGVAGVLICLCNRYAEGISVVFAAMITFCIAFFRIDSRYNSVID